MIPLPLDPVKDFVPRGGIRITYSWLFSIIILLISLGIAWGGYKAGYQNQQGQIDAAQKRIEKLEDSINGVTYEMGRLRVSVDDLKATLDRKR